MTMAATSSGKSPQINNGIMVKKYFLRSILLFGIQFLCAQTVTDSLSNINTLEEVRISALYINDSLLNAPATIAILSKGDLSRNNNSDITTAVNTVSGVFMQSSNLTTNRISIRGIGARTPYGTNKIRAFYGNIPLTSGDSETTIDDLDIENISQVEIIKGPLSSVYGAGLGGAILVSPKVSGTNGRHAAFSTTHGSFGLVKNSINYGFDNKSSSLNLSYHKLETDGWRENSAYNREGVTLSGELFRKANGKLTYFGNYISLKAFIPSSIDKKTFDTNPKAAAATWLASKGYKAYESAFGGLGYDFKISDGMQNSTSVFVNYKDNYEPRPFDVLHQYTFAYGARTQFSGNFKVGKKAGTFIFGVEYFNDDYSGRTFENRYKQNNGQGSLEGDLLTGNEQQRNFYNAFAQMRLQLAKKFELQGGLNVNKTHFTLINDYPAADVSDEKYTYDAIWSPQISVLFKPSGLHTIYASASHGYSLPSVSETLTAGGAINTEIKPESGFNYEIGGKFYLFGKTVYTEIALYRMEINDLLIAQRIGDDQYVGVNAGETLHQGIEISLNHNWQIGNGTSLNWYASGSFGEYKFGNFIDRGTDFSGNKLTGVPAHKANAGIIFNTGFGWYLSSDFLFVDKIPLDDANSVDADAYKILNAKTGYRFEIVPKLGCNLAFGINNIADERYASLILPNALPVGNNTPRYYYPGLPVNYYANIQLNYSF
jgi:iron complex outermembrane recepter protein